MSHGLYVAYGSKHYTDRLLATHISEKMWRISMELCFHILINIGQLRRHDLKLISKLALAIYHVWRQHTMDIIVILAVNPLAKMKSLMAYDEDVHNYLLAHYSPECQDPQTKCILYDHIDLTYSRSANRQLIRQHTNTVIIRWLIMFLMQVQAVYGFLT